MKYRNSDLMEMLEYLELFAFEERFKAIYESPKFSSLDSVQFLQELVAAEYDYRKEARLDRLLRLSRLGKNTALASNLKSGNGRIYNENVVRQILTLGFVEKRLNLCIFGQSGIGKTYAAKAIGAECCRGEYKTYFTDCTTLIDELLFMKNSDSAKYTKKLKYFGKIQVLILDDFLITHINQERASILFQLIKLREVQGTSTVVTCQYPADDWGDFMGDQNEPALSDAIRRRLTSGFILNIETA